MVVEVVSNKGIWVLPTLSSVCIYSSFPSPTTSVDVFKQWLLQKSALSNMTSNLRCSVRSQHPQKSPTSTPPSISKTRPRSARLTRFSVPSTKYTLPSRWSKECWRAVSRRRTRSTSLGRSCCRSRGSCQSPRLRVVRVSSQCRWEM